MHKRLAAGLLSLCLVAGKASAQAPVDPGTPLPPGHPPLGAPAPAEPPAGPSPHGLAEPNEPEPDRAGPAAHVPSGTIEAEIVDAGGKPMASVDVRLGIVYQTIAEGERRSEQHARTDAKGFVRFAGLAGGSAHSYRVSVTQGPAKYLSAPLTLHPQMGHYVRLHVYPAVREVEQSLVGMRSFMYIAPRDDVFQVEVMFRIFNIGKVTWVPQNVVLSLPAGSKAITAQESMSDVGFVPEDGAVRLQGTISPGQHDAMFRFQIPNEHDETRRFEMPLPPHVAEARVIVEASRGMELRVDGFANAEATENQNGERVLVTGRQLGRGEEQMKELYITLSGIPTPGPGRWYAVAIALGIAAAGLWSAVTRRAPGKPTEFAPEDRSAARELLVDELVRLERAHVSGDVGPRTYEEARRVLLDALARLEAEPGPGVGRSQSPRRRKARVSAA